MAKEPKAKKGEAKIAGPVENANEGVAAGYVPRMRQHYEETVRKALMEKFGYTNAMQIPKFADGGMVGGSSPGASGGTVNLTDRDSRGYANF